MSPSTISHLVGCREWLKAGIKVEGKFAEALEYIERYIKTSDKRPNALGIWFFFILVLFLVPCFGLDFFFWCLWSLVSVPWLSLLSVVSCFCLLLGSVLSPVLFSHLCHWCFSFISSPPQLGTLSFELNRSDDGLPQSITNSPLLCQITQSFNSTRSEKPTRLQYTYIAFIDLFPQIHHFCWPLWFQFLVSLLSTQSLTSIDFLLIL